MFSCGSNKKNVKEISLANKRFEDLIFNVKSSKLKFDPIEGAFKQISNEDPNYRLKGNNEEMDKLNKEELFLKKEVSAKQERIKELNEKMIEINKKIEKMNQMLNVDLNEREYIYETKKKFESLQTQKN
jgi:hypothetical protein